MQYIQLGTQSNGSIPTPGSDKLNFFIGTDGIPKLKDENGTVTEFGGTGSTASVISVTYSELYASLTGATLTPGAFYEITDYETCYDQPDFDRDGGSLTGDYKQSGVIDPIIVLAISSDRISENAYQAAYPHDKIKYDVLFNQTENANPAKGRITERIDEYGNRTDYDHRTILFKRYENYVPNFDNQIPGTVTLTDGTVTGIATTFTSLSVNDIIFIENSGEYRIVSITDDDEMAVTGITYSNISGANFYQTYTFNKCYKRNNVADPSIYTEHLTFQYNDSTYINNYIGNYANLRDWNENPFLLANNVFVGEHVNNRFGDSCYNNTFDDDCTDNVVGSWFYNNTFDDDFDNNVITTSFYENYISANFQHNITGFRFYQNLITNGSFYRNQIGNDFNENRIVNNDFQNNVIGNQFNNNFIKQEFYKNVIGNGFNGNTISAYFYGNHIGNGANNNNIALNPGNNGEFKNNRIGEYFEDNNTNGYFYNNRIGNYFENNTIEDEFAYNEIGNTFYNNVIGEYFGYGYSTTRGNKIGSYFQNNAIRDHFYDNVICDGFINNFTPVNFQYNDIKYTLNGVDFRVHNKNINSYSHTSPNSSSDGTYPNVYGASSLDGEGALFDVIVFGGIVVNVNLTNAGYDYTNGEQIIIPSALFNGDGTDLVVTVSTVTPEAMVAGDYNCTIIRDPSNQLLLTTVTTTGLYYMSDITEIYD